MAKVKCPSRFTFVVIVSAMLCTSLAGLWVRSRVVRDYGWVFIPWPGDGGGRRFLKLDVDSDGGQVGIDWKVWTAADREQVRQHNDLAAANVYYRTFKEIQTSYARSGPPTAWNAIGFKWYRGPTHCGICVPYWSCVALTAVLPLAWTKGAMRRRRRRRAGHCVNCGYDLRATAGRCPECGLERP